jgi:hypothetical protein
VEDYIEVDRALQVCEQLTDIDKIRLINKLLENPQIASEYSNYQRISADKSSMATVLRRVAKYIENEI